MKNKNYGFTLVELLVVIAIIGILSTVAVVNLQASRIRAREAAAISFMNPYKSAAILCATENLQMSDPYDGSTYNGNGEVCTNTGVYWPDITDLPEGYEYLDVFDIDAYDGEWVYFMVDLENEVSAIICTNLSGCYAS